MRDLQKTMIVGKSWKSKKRDFTSQAVSFNVAFMDAGVELKRTCTSRLSFHSSVVVFFFKLFIHFSK